MKRHATGAYQEDNEHDRAHGAQRRHGDGHEAKHTEERPDSVRVARLGVGMSGEDAAHAAVYDCMRPK